MQTTATTVQETAVATLTPAPPTTTLPTAEPIPSTDFAYGAPIDPNVPLGPVRVGEVEITDRQLLYADPNTWLHTLHIPDAAYLMVHFNTLDLAPDDYIVIKDAAGQQLSQYPSADMQTDDTGSWSLSVVGDTIQIELVSQLGAATSGYLGATIDQYTRGYPELNQSQAGAAIMPDNDVTIALHPALDFKTYAAHYDAMKSVCSADDRTDVICSAGSNPTEYANSDAVVRLLINTTEACTGFRLSGLNRIVTNAHCISSQTDVDNTEVHFNDENTSCGGSTSPSTQVTGATLLLVNALYDVAIFEVNNFATISGFGHLDPAFCTAPALNDPIYIPQHPGGLPQQLGIASDSNAGGICRVDDAVRNGFLPDTNIGYFCDTSGGSSGSPVISSSSHEVIALHHTGAPAACSSALMNSGVRMDILWPQIMSVFPGQYPPCVLPTPEPTPEDTPTPTPVPTNAPAVEPTPTGLVQLGPSGDVAATKPLFTWQPQANAQGYYLWIQDTDNDKTIFADWLDPADLDCTTTTQQCAIKSEVALDTGNHSWYVLPRIDGVNGTWSAGMPFRNTQAPPQKPTAVPDKLFPNNVTTDNHLKLAWQAMATAEEYDLWVTTVDGNLVLSRTITPDQVNCGTANGACALDTEVFLETGVYNWWVRAKNCGGVGEWGQFAQFSVTVQPPAAPLLGASPVADAQVQVFTWQAVPNATHYYLEVFDSSGAVVQTQQLDNVASGCVQGSVCTYTSNRALNAGQYQWHVAAWSPNGYGAWSSPAQFEVGQ